MAGLESEHIYGVQIRESANDGSDFTNPDADYRIAFLGEDGLWHVKDSAGTVTSPFSGAGSVATDSLWDAAGDLAVGTGADTAAKLSIGGARTNLVSDGSTAVWQSKPHAIVRYTTGDIALTATSMTAISGPGDCVVAAATGDVLLCSMSARADNTTSQSMSFDMASIVSAAAVNFLSSLNGTALTTGVPAWYIDSASKTGSGGTVLYVVQAGDISGGNVTMRLYARVSGNRTLSASATVPLTFSVKNLR